MQDRTPVHHILYIQVVDKVFHVFMASDRKQRTLAGEAVGDNITAEMGQMEGEKRYGKLHLSTFPT